MVVCFDIFCCCSAPPPSCTTRISNHSRRARRGTSGGQMDRTPNQHQLTSLPRPFLRRVLLSICVVFFFLPVLFVLGGCPSFVCSECAAATLTKGKPKGTKRNKQTKLHNAHTRAHTHNSTKPDARTKQHINKGGNDPGEMASHCTRLSSVSSCEIGVGLR